MSDALGPKDINDLVRRLRGEYRIAICDGLGATGGGEEPEGYMMNAVIDLQTGTKKQTTINTLNGGIKLIDGAIVNLA